MPVISLMGNKGGSGKTTLAINLGAGLSNIANSALLDADPQGSSIQWYQFVDQDDGVDVYQANGQLREQVSDLNTNYDYVVCDCPPSINAEQTQTLLEISDIVLIPVQPSPIDVWATIKLEEVIIEAQKSNQKLKAYVLINQLEPRVALSRMLRGALSELELPVTETALRRRAIYKNSVLDGKSVFDAGKLGAEAATEITQLIEEIIK
ncbi:MAG: ParA family partition ATPase [Gammaproteobacteria bacterium]|nr:ParA family partition ATPase [Gammaproteobacteria bacterium]